MLVKSSSGKRGNDRFTTRRRLRRRRVLVGLIIFFLLLLAGFLYAVNQDFARIKNIQVFGADPSLASLATRALVGSYLGIIPRSSTLFYPGDRIRANILAEHPDYAAVSLFRTGLTGLSIRVNARVPVARWCGTALASSSDCYVFDGNGILYATSSVDAPINTFALYEPAPSSGLIRATLPNADRFPSLFDFARQLGSLGVPVVSIVIRDGEVDDYVASGARLTYVLGSEQAAYTALVSARTSVDLTDPTLDYVDLRFDGKVYVKRNDASTIK